MFTFFRFEKLNQHIIITKMAWTPAVMRRNTLDNPQTFDTENSTS